MRKQGESVFPFLYDVAGGNIADHYSMLKFGYNSNVGVTEEDVWETGGSYTYLASAEQLQISSTSASDTGAPAGTGAQTVKIFGLDENWIERDEEIGLAGLSSVTTDRAYLRIFRVFTTTAGSGNSNIGTISVMNNASSSTMATITPGHNQSLMAMWSVPDSYTAYMVKWWASVLVAPTKVAEMHLYVRSFGSVFQLKHIYHADSSFVHEFAVPLTIAAKSDIAIRATADGGGGPVSAGFDLWYNR